MKKLKVLPDPDALASEATALFIKIGTQAIKDSGSFSVALAGGSTPKATYRVIANEAQRNAAISPSPTLDEEAPQGAPTSSPHITTARPDGIANGRERSETQTPSRPEVFSGFENYQADPRSAIDWSRVHFFWGDERCVPPDHPESNYHMAWNALLNHLPVPYENLHRMEGELDPGLAAQRYQDELGRILGSQPHIDLIFLGMGTDGHTASLFPGTPAVSNMKAWVAANFVQSMNTWRLTLTPVIINLARNVLFIVSGESKAGVLRQVFKGEHNPSLLPSQIINPIEGNLYWFVDKAAAKLLTHSPDASM